MNEPKLITSSNLSQAWVKAFDHVVECSGKYGMVVRLEDFEGDLPEEDERISIELNERLNAGNFPTIEQTALTIVPYQRWLREGKPDLIEFCEWYQNKFLPRLKGRCSKNRHGTYFERLISYTGTRIKKGEQEFKTLNQIEFVTTLWNRKREKNAARPRQSALQLAIFDPAKDATGSALSPFPCLQQISLTYQDKGTLEINAYYPTQFVFDRAYGNYLGLCQLGHFIAHYMGVRLTALNCFVARSQIGSGTKSNHRELCTKLREFNSNL